MSDSTINFYAHVCSTTFEIRKITIEASAGEGEIAFVIDEELAKKFLTGAHIPHQWIAGSVGNSFELRKKREKKLIVNRIDTAPITEVPIKYLGLKSEDEALFGNEVAIVLDDINNKAKIYYNGQAFNKKREVTLYFTREGDPSRLLAAFCLSQEVLNNLKEIHNLSHWPNPITMKLECMHNNQLDLSIFSQKNGTAVAAYVRN